MNQSPALSESKIVQIETIFRCKDSYSKGSSRSVSTSFLFIHTKGQQVTAHLPFTDVVFGFRPEYF
jgi:hypothetical protein